MQGSARDFLKPKLVDSVEISKNEYRVVLEPSSPSPERLTVRASGVCNSACVGYVLCIL